MNLISFSLFGLTDKSVHAILNYL